VATFAFVRGSWHGAWCWELLINELEALEHRSVAVDLPCDDEEAGCEEYAEVVRRAIEAVHDPIVVGHSLGGLTIPLVAARRRVHQLVYLCAFVPRQPWNQLR